MSTLNLSDLEQVALTKKRFELDENLKAKLNKSFEFLNEFAGNKIIYGINTGFGPMAQYKIDDDKLNELQYNLIRSHSSGTGKALTEEYVRAVLLARINNFLQGNSGISLGVVDKLIEFLNKEVYPEIFEHGSVGASGDLVQLAHLGLALIGEGYVYYKGERRPTKEVMDQLGMTPLKVQLRDGLGLMNGTSCMTGIGSVNIIYAKRFVDWSIISSAIINEVLEAFDDSFSAGLNGVKRHKGQQEVARRMRAFLGDSQLIRKREELFNDNDAMSRKKFEKKIQEYYSIRCVPQIVGPALDTIAYAQEVIENELNSTNDNPIVSVENDNVFHGGNFHGDYISLEMDKIKTVVTRLTMLAERQLNFLMNDKINEKFPSFLNKGTLGFNFGIQGMQFTATSTTAESQTLSFPNYVHSIPNNNDNQDIVSMGTNSAVIARNVIDNGYQVMAIHMIAVCQALDFLTDEEKTKLSSRTKEIYNLVRNIVPMIVEDKPQFENIAAIAAALKNYTIEL